MARSKRSPKRIPAFASEAEERRFWEAHDTADYVDWTAARPVRLPGLKPSTETISLRLPAALLADLKTLANRRDVPYQSLLKVFLADRVARECRAARAPARRAGKAGRPRRRSRQRRTLTPRA